MKISFFVLVICFVFLTCKGKQKKQDEPQTSEIIQPQKWWTKLPRSIYASLEKIQTTQDWYEVYKLTEGTYAIYEAFQIILTGEGDYVQDGEIRRYSFEGFDILIRTDMIKKSDLFNSCPLLLEKHMTIVCLRISTGSMIFLESRVKYE